MGSGNAAIWTMSPEPRTRQGLSPCLSRNESGFVTPFPPPPFLQCQNLQSQRTGEIVNLPISQKETLARPIVTFEILHGRLAEHQHTARP